MIDVPDTVNRARALIDEKQFDQAISLLQACEQACPGDEFVAAELAEACRRKSSGSAFVREDVVRSSWQMRPADVRVPRRNTG